MEDTTYLFIEFDVDNRVALQMVQSIEEKKLGLLS